MIEEPEELGWLMSAACDGRASDVELARLAEVLGDDPVARDQYLRYVDLHSALSDETLPAFESDIVDYQIGPKGTLTRKRKEEQPSAPVTLAHASGYDRRVVRYVAIAASLLMIASLGFLAYSNSAGDRHRDPTALAVDSTGSPPQLATQFNTPYPVATVLLPEDCRWSGNDLSEGDRLCAGPVELVSGTAVLRFDGGAELVLALSVGTKQSLSYTQSGVQIPGEDSPSQLFRKLFVQGSKQEVEAQVAKLRSGRSILNSVGERARQLGRRVGPSDREKLDQFYTGVRDLEKRLHKSEQWELKPKSKVSMEAPRDFKDPGALIERTRVMFDLARIAMETDSTRLISIYIHQNDAKPNIAGVDTGTHPLTHHGNQPEKLDQLKLIEEAQFKELASLLGGLADSDVGSGSLLDQTSVIYGTSLGNGNSHANNNLPVLIAGGGFRHAQHLSLGGSHDYPLPNLFVSVLQRLGIETDQFATATGTMRGLELA